MKEKYILTVHTDGRGKLVNIEEFREQHRGGKGVIAAPQGLSAIEVLDNLDSHILIASKKGKVIRIKASDIKCSSRTAYGNRLMRLDGEDDLIVGVKVINAPVD